MSKRVVVIGGSGYIGSRLIERLEKEGIRYLNIDPQILQGNEIRDRDVRSLDPRKILTGDDIVVWLASLHECPQEDNYRWGNIYHELMVRVPERWCYLNNPFIYVSSMRALGGLTLYSYAKREAERRLVSHSNVRIVRFGTVWGNLRTDMVNRIHTAPNQILLGKVKHTNYPFYTTSMNRALHTLIYFVISFQQPAGEVLNIVDAGGPYTTEQLSSESKTPFSWIIEKSRTPSDLQEVAHPQKLYEGYYL